VIGPQRMFARLTTGMTASIARGWNMTRASTAILPQSAKATTTENMPMGVPTFIRDERESL
jgi:hypothetical protein